MLKYLRIKNFALIEDVEIDFQRGLTLFTGETGAGKSIIIQALDVLLGARAYTDYIRSGAGQAQLEAIFSLAGDSPVIEYLKKNEIEEQDGELIISRSLNKKGNNRCRINGQLVPLNMIKEISSLLIDIHGQHEHQSLLDENQHLGLLDAFGGQDLLKLKEEVRDIYHKLNRINHEILQLEENRREIARKIDLLKYQLEEINRAELSSTEESELNARRKTLIEAEKLKDLLHGIVMAMEGAGFGEEGLLAELGRGINDLKNFVEIPEINTINEGLSEAYYRLEETQLSINRFLEDLNFEPEELDEIENRLNQIYNLKRKYGDSIEEILKYRDEIAAELDELEFSEEKLNNLKKEREEINQYFEKKLAGLTKLRKEVAALLEERVKKELYELAMPDAIFKVRITEKRPQVDGKDQVSFYISTNPGEDLKPLARIASGGEISRIMLALKTITADIEQIPVLVFDEIDVGIGGKTAQKVADRLALLSHNCQILGITHLPQIAVIADFHYFIMKITEKNNTRTIIQKLNREEREKELARMLEGDVTPASLKHARNMLDKAEVKKENLRKSK